MAKLGELVFQPTFEKAKRSDRREPEARDDAAAIKTYRYLRLGLIVVVVALTASVVIQRHNAGCWQGSISSYYYSPARPIFVSGLVAIAVSLIVIKGSTVIEDVLLNVAGMLAPIVAFVPTTEDAACVPHPGVVGGTNKLPAAIVGDVRNNIAALLVAGFLAFAVAVVIFLIEQAGSDKLATGYVKSQVFVLALTGLSLAVGVWLLASDHILQLHAKAAILMFGVLAIASGFNGIWLFAINKGDGSKTSPHWRSFASLYLAVGIAMIVAGVIIRSWPGPWAHRTLVLEFTETGLFAAMWVVQSVERWGRILQAEP
jgi:hypothetical protein